MTGCGALNGLSLLMGQERGLLADHCSYPLRNAPNVVVRISLSKLLSLE